MMTQVAPVNRLSARMGNRVLNFEVDQRPNIEIDADMQKMLVGLAPQLSPTKTIRVPGFFGSRTETARMTKADFFAEFPKKFRELKSLYAAVSAWFPEIIRANIECRNVHGNPALNVTIAASLAERMPVRVEPPMLSMAELAVKSESDILQAMNDYLRRGSMEVVTAFYAGLQALLDAQQIGQIQWVSPRVCKFYFYRNVIEDEDLGVRSKGGPTVTERRQGSQITQTVKQLKERSIRRTVKHALHYHELMECQRLPSSDSRIAMPARVRDMLSMAPKFLGQFAEVVIGDEIFRRIVERDVRSEKVTEEFEDVKQFTYTTRDPAIVVGPYVITGWEPEEIKR